MFWSLMVVTLAYPADIHPASIHFSNPWETWFEGIQFLLRRASRRCHDLSTGITHFWKWSEWVPKCCTNIVCCQDMWELYFECKKFKETVQTVNFTVFTMCRRELPAEMTYFWWKLKKRKRIFLNVLQQYDLNGVYHEKADVLGIPKML